MIYEHALFHDEGVSTRTEPALLRTSKQIRAEAELMFYAINEFHADIHEEDDHHGICSWLKHKAGPRLSSIRKLTLHVEMPSVGSKTYPAENAADDALPDDEDAFLPGLLMMMHIMAKIRKVKFDRCHQCVVHFTVNGAPDCESFEKIEAMTLREQDRYQGAKFLLMSLVYGERRTVDAMSDENGGPAQLYGLYDAIRRHRAGSPGSVCERAES
jgi:hypothetical protein